MDGLNVGQVQLQEYGSKQDVLIRMERQPGGDDAQQTAITKVRAAVGKDLPGAEIRRVEAVGASVSDELFHNGMLAMGLAILAMLAYISFRFEWQFGIGAVVTLILDVTKLVGFYVRYAVPVQHDGDRRDPHGHGLLDQRQGRGLRPGA